MNPNVGGRPEHDDKQYEIWLEEMRPFLERGKSLYKSMELSALIRHKDSIYKKLRENDWFSEKVKAYNQALGEKINDTFVSLIEKIYNKVKKDEQLTDQESKLLMFGAEKHRSAQPFFVNRFETAKGRPVEEIIEALEVQADKENVDDVAENIAKELESQPQQITAAAQIIQDPNSIDPNATITA